MNRIASTLAFFGVASLLHAAPTDSLNIQLSSVEVSAIKSSLGSVVQSGARTIVTRKEAERYGIMTIRAASDLAPNVYIPDYGTRMTSSIYVRGIGARIDQPVVGLNVDNVPILNKDNYDFDIADIDRIELIRGPQCTMYGRNTMGGVINVSTLSPLKVSGLRAKLLAGTGGQWKATASAYHRLTNDFGVGISAAFNRLGGFYKNSYNGKYADRSEGGSVRLKTSWQSPSRKFLIENTASLGIDRQHGYPYEWSETGRIAYNDTCFYRRLAFVDGLSASWKVGGPLSIEVSSITSFQYLHDNMTLDQDFLTDSYFTLTQARHEWAVTQDFVVRGKGGSRYSWLAGLFGFHRRTNMRAPVNFKETGIEKLIVAHRNEINPSYPIRWVGDNLLLGSTFLAPVSGVAIYHRSNLNLGRGWEAWADLRLDYEHTSLEYASNCNAAYDVFDAATGSVMRRQDLVIDNDGTLSRSFTQLLPKIGVSKQWPLWRLTASIGKGYKAGGYNTQMFSDVLQQKLMEVMGVAAKYDIDQIVGYDPEKSWNYEISALYTSPEGRLRAQATAFYIDCRDQQLTTFPDGTTTGRIMANAGKTRSWGLEFSGAWRPDNQGRWIANWAYGYTNAHFVDFNDGRRSYDGNRVPYAPAHTLFAGLTYRLPVGKLWLEFTAALRGVGDIWWDEAQTRKQPFYALLEGSVALQASKWSVALNAQNLTDTKYYTFSYVSMSNTFFQRGKPIRADITFRLDLSALNL